MTAKSSEQQVAHIRGSFARFDSQSVTRLLKQVVPEASLSGESLDVLARRLVEPSWSRLAIRDLDEAGLFAIRVLAQLPQGISANELDAIARIATRNYESGPRPSQQLVEAGVALLTSDSAFRRTDARLKVIGALRERWLTLVPAPAERFDLPELSPAEISFREVRAEFELGVFLAVIEHLRPRATRVSDMHRGDEKNVIEKLSGMFGDEASTRERLRELLRTDLTKEEDGRLRVNRDELKLWIDPLAMLLLRRAEGSRHNSTWRALIGHLTLSSGWRSYADLLEIGTLATFEHTYSYRSAQSLAAEVTELSRLPGMLTQDVDGVHWYRLSAAAQRALEGDVTPRSFGTALLVQPNLQIVAQPGTPLAVLASLGSFCRLVSADQVAVFSIDEGASKRAASEGWTANEILTLLEKHSAHGVPSTVARALTDWVRTRMVATVALGTIVLVDLPLAEVRKLAGKIAIEELKSGVFRADGDAGMKLVAALRKAQVACRVFGPGSSRREEDLESDVEGSSGAPQLEIRKLMEQAMNEVSRLRQVPRD